MTLLAKLKPARILVAGDFMLDLYTFGKVERISPEAPVPILHVEREKWRVGGTGNAVLNLAALGMQVLPFGRIGADEAGKQIKVLLSQEKIPTSALFVDPNVTTPVKNRVIADNQQLLRLDKESNEALSLEMEEQLLKEIPTLLKEVDGVAISDYAKGFFSPRLLSRLIEEARLRALPIIVDPKGDNFRIYNGATLIKPNQKEAFSAAKLSSKASLDEVAAAILEQIEVEILMVTRAKDGIALFRRQQQRQDFPAAEREVKDVTGAGDTVLAVVAAALVNRLDLAEIAHLANCAGGIAVERVGCAIIGLKDLEGRL